MRSIKVGHFKIGTKEPLTFICGPCVIESEEFLLKVAKELKELFSRFPFQLIFKSSYDKANRTSIHSFRGPGLDQGLKILEKIKKEFDLPILTDVHTPDEAVAASGIVDCIQIPAFLSRQTDLLVAAGKKGASINVKKGQFLSPWDMKNVVNKLTEVGQHEILLTDRGTSFGYNNLVADMRSIPIMQALGYPVCFDATHSLQLPGGLGDVTGGQREFGETLAKAAIAAGANALFIEVHPDPASAKSDASTMMSLDELHHFLPKAQRLYEAVQCSLDSSLSSCH